MRTTVEPPPSTRCDHCGGLLTLKRVAATQSGRGSSTNIFACTSCGQERSVVVYDDQHAPAGSSHRQRAW